jgi:hypothetical protein
MTAFAFTARRRPRLLAAGVLFALTAFFPAFVCAQKVYFTELDSQRISRSNRDGSGVETLGYTSAPLGLAVDSASAKRYWVVRTLFGGPVNGIIRSNLDGGRPEILVRGLGEPVGLALDLRHGTMYWTDHAPDSPKIQRANLDGGNVQTLVASGLVDPIGIALDVGGGKVYWVDHDANRIQRANLDGSGVQTLVSSGLNRPEGITVDVARDKIYWTETIGMRIQRASLDGSGPEVVLASPTFHNLVEVKLDVAEGMLYFTDYTADKVQRATIEGQGLQDLLTGRGGPWGVALDRAPCSVVVDLPQSRWGQLALPCDPGPASSVAELLHGLDGQQDSSWAIFQWDPVGQSYRRLEPGDTLHQGEGFWLKTQEENQSVTFEGLEADTTQRFVVPLAAGVDGEWSMVGHPYEFGVAWTSVRVLHDGELYTLDQADPLVGGVHACSMNPPDPSCIMSRVAFTWNGAAYDSFDGMTPGAGGLLLPSSAFWVRTYQEADLLVPALPAVPSSGDNDPKCDPGAEWWLRLTVQSGELVDAGNLLGQLRDAAQGFDRHDLRELEPFAEDYLTVVFPHPRWGEHADDYTTDFHPSAPTTRADLWRFEVRSGEPGREVTLSWNGPTEVLLRCRLLDLGDPEVGRSRPAVAAVTVTPDCTYTFVMEGTRRQLAWVVGARDRPALPAAVDAREVNR